MIFRPNRWSMKARPGRRQTCRNSPKPAGSISISISRMKRMADPGDVVTVDFVGATGTKRRPAVVVSSTLYHQHRPDLILGVLTSQVSRATTPLDYVLADWASAGLRQPSAFRAYFGMATPAAVRVIGHLSARDWEGIQACLIQAFAFPDLATP